MKKLIAVLLFIMLSTQATYAAVTPDPSPTGTQSITGLDQQINNLKDRIASRVAELKLVDKKGFIGTVIDIAETQITISDTQGNTRFIDVDELTKFSTPSAKASFGISDITKGTTIGVLGLYNKESRRTLARFVDVLVLPQVISGAVTAIDKTNYTVTVTTPDQQDILADISTITKIYTYSKDTGNVKSGFSKIVIGQRIMVVGFPDVTIKNKIISSRLLIFPTLAANPKIAIITPDTIGVTPSTGSGTKLTPIIRK